MLGGEQRIYPWQKAVTYSMTAVRKNGTQASFRHSMLNLQTSELEDCILSVFHLGILRVAQG